jgi:hypothetical protein
MDYQEVDARFAVELHIGSQVQFEKAGASTKGRPATQLYALQAKGDERNPCRALASIQVQVSGQVRLQLVGGNFPMEEK